MTTKLPAIVEALLSTNKELEVRRTIVMRPGSCWTDMADIYASTLVQGFNNDKDCFCFMTPNTYGVPTIYFVSTEEHVNDIRRFITV